MKSRSLHSIVLGCLVLITVGMLSWAGSASAQDQIGRVQKITERLHAGETDAYILKDLQPGDKLTVSMRATSGNLDPIVGILTTTMPLEEILTRYQTDVQSLLAENEDVALALDEVRGQYFLAWDDDSGDGYAAALEYVVPTAGNYMITASASLSALGRATFGDYELLIGLNAPEVLEGEAQPTGAPIAERLESTVGLSPAVEETSATITAEVPIMKFRLADIEAGETLFVYVEPTSGNLIPAIILRDYGGKPSEEGNLDGQEPQATLQFTMPEGAAEYSLDVQSALQPDGTMTVGDFRLLVGVNAPDVLTGQALPQGEKVLDAPIEVKVGIKVNRISEVDSQNENFTVLGSLRMDWADPALAFSPDSCNCSVKLYTEKEFDRFLADVRSRWPDFAFFNQLGNRWVQSRSAAIWPDGSARYAEDFSTTFQADFDFQKYPFDTQTFPIFLDMLFPADVYTETELPGYSEIDPQHGEDEFIITDFTVTTSTVAASAADRPVSRFTFAFSAPRHLDYYVLQVFVPIILIILISWFTFFLRDYTRRIEAAAANILLFIAFNFTLADNYPRLGYITFIDAIMAVTFVVNVLVLLYNVMMKRMENAGKSERVERIDRFFDWAYPLAYLGLLAFVILRFF